MKAPAMDVKGRWAAAGGGSLLTVALVVGIFCFADVSAPALLQTRSAPVMFVTRATDDALRQERLKNDLTPLFLPTEFNARLPEPPLRTSGQAFLDADPVKLSFPEAAPNFGARLPPVATLNGKRPSAAGPLDAMVTDAVIPPAYGFGRADVALVPQQPRGGIVEVVATATAEKVRNIRLPADARPPVEQPWQPMEFSALVNAVGLVGPLEIISSSRVEAVDTYFKNYLVQRLRIGDGLPPGFYRITVGP